MSIETKKLRRAALMGSTATLAASFALGLGVTPVSAQDADTEEFEEVVVTGSRIIRKDLESVSPLSITSAEEIKLSGYTRIEDMMNSLPQIETSQTAFISNGSSGTASLDLRGLGSNRTLVLMNGRRMQAGGIYSSSPDINQIPAALVKRVEVLTGGASATYGADAVAGVVNFVMNDDFEGFEISAGINGYQHNNNNEYIQGLMDAKGFDYPTGSSGIDGKTYNVDVSMGGDFADGNGHATVYATFQTNDELLQSQRDYSSCALNSAGTACGGSGNAIVPNFYVSKPNDSGSFNWGDWDYWTLDPSGEGFIPSVDNLYNYAPVNHFLRPQERFTFGSFVDYEINEYFHPYMEMTFMRNRTEAQIAESGTFFADNYIIPIDSDIIDDTQRQQLMDTFGIMPGESFTAYIGKRNVEGGPRVNKLENTSFRMVVGTEGQISDNWRYDASLQYGSTSSNTAYINDFFSDRVEPAILDGSYPVFGYQEITPEAAANMTGVAVMTGVTKQYVAQGYVMGDLGFAIPTAEDPIAAVLGVEYRKDVFSRDADEVYAQGLLLGQGGTTESITGSYNVKEIFAELNVPIVQDAEFAESITLELAGRYSDYNTSGGAETYKIGLNWVVNDIIKLRGSYNRAVRAPNVSELFAPQSTGLWSGTDPCSGTDPEFTAAQCALTGVTATQYGNVVASPASQYNGLFGGNPDLEPEVADTITFGAVISPMDDLQITVDYWDIDLTNVIGSVGAELTVRQCGLTGNAQYCDNINRQGGSLWVGSNSFVKATSINLAARRWKGIDVQADYMTELGDGTVTANLLGTYMIKKEYNPIPGDDTAIYDCVSTISTDCFTTPEWRHTLRVSYESDSFWTASVKWRYFGKVDYDGTVDTLLIDNGIKSQSYIDLTGAFTVNEHVGFVVGVNNVFDKEPPMVGGALSSNANAVAGYYDTLGRYLHASVQFTF